MRRVTQRSRQPLLPSSQRTGPRNPCDDRLHADYALATRQLVARWNRDGVRCKRFERAALEWCHADSNGKGCSRAAIAATGHPACQQSRSAWSNPGGSAHHSSTMGSWASWLQAAQQPEDTVKKQKN